VKSTIVYLEVKSTIVYLEVKSTIVYLEVKSTIVSLELKHIFKKMPFTSPHRGRGRREAAGEGK
jgi:hypothetical protein